MLKKKRGRPAKPKENLKLVTIEQAVLLMRQKLKEIYEDDLIVERMALSKRTLYNLRSLGKLTAYGKPGCALLDVDEVLGLCG